MSKYLLKKDRKKEKLKFRRNNILKRLSVSVFVTAYPLLNFIVASPLAPLVSPKNPIRILLITILSTIIVRASIYPQYKFIAVSQIFSENPAQSCSIALRLFFKYFYISGVSVSRGELIPLFVLLLKYRATSSRSVFPMSLSKYTRRTLSNR